MLAMALCAVLAAAGCSTGTNAVDQGAGSSNRYVAGDGSIRIVPAAKRGTPPQATGTLLAGGSFDLRDLRGTVTVINFWGSWCPPCRAEAGDLESVYQQTKASGVTFVGVDVKDQKASAEAFQKTFAIGYPSLYDRLGRVALQFRDTPPNSVPATLVIDRSGRVAVVILKSLRAEELLPIVRKVAAEAK
ncbi:MAG: TlpA family protein disulfide reductase [Pseudonocardiales bacterium]|nr:MAG: TlpA family protein disulfide reductase [Pseudonocardiales bacterium]